MKKYLVILTTGKDLDNCVNKVVGESYDLNIAFDMRNAIQSSMNIIKSKHFQCVNVYTEEEVSKNNIKITY